MTLSKIIHYTSSYVKSTVTTSVNSLDRRLNKWLFPLVLMLTTLIVFVYIEYKHPYFFLQDDNRDYYLPYFVHNFESLLNGELALYNFHQFLGIPSLATGQTGALYPISYLSVFISDLVFGHYFVAVDIQVIIHLLIGAVGIYKLMIFLEIHRGSAFFAGITWPLSSFIVYVSNSWVVVSAAAAYFPWMLLFSLYLHKKPHLNVTVYAVTVRLLLFYAGHIQFFIYSVIFEFITLVLYSIFFSKGDSKKSSTILCLKKYIKSYIYVFILSLPLLLPMWHLTTISAGRSEPLQFHIFVNQFFPADQLLKGLLYPFMQVDEGVYASFRNMVNLSHIGYITFFLVLFGIVDRYITRRNTIKLESVKLSVFTLPALFAFLWSTNWLFNYLIYQIPILNRFRWPFKLIFYFDFYLIVIAALILSFIIGQRPWKSITKNTLLIVLLTIQVSNFVFLYTETPYKDFGEHHGDILPLEEKLKNKLIDGRIISLGFDTWTPTPKNNTPYFTAPTLGFNYATLWGLDYFAGYEPLIPAANNEACLGLNFTAIIKSGDLIPVAYLRKAGVKWYIVPKDKADPYSKLLLKEGIIPKYVDDNRVVFHDSKSSAMVFYADGKSIKSDSYRVTTNSIALSIDLKQSQQVIFNYLYNPFFEAFIDGEKTNMREHDKIHFSILIPEGKHDIMIRYKDPYLIIGTSIAMAFLTLAAFWRMKT